MWIGISINSNSETQLKVQQQNQQREMNKEQNDILFELAKINNPHVNQFVDDWRKTYADITEEKLKELYVIRGNILKNPDISEQYTISYHEKKEHVTNGQPAGFTAVIGGDEPEITVEPGL